MRLRRGITNQLFVLIAILLVLPAALTVYMLEVIHRTELALVESHKAKLTKAMEMLAEDLPGTFEEMLARHGMDGAQRRDKVTFLNGQLKPLIERVGREFPGIELGYYSRDLDVILDGNTENYGENFSTRRKQALDQAMREQKTVLETIGLGQGGMLETYRPLVRDGEVFGAVVAREDLSKVYRQVNRVQRDAYAVILASIALGLGGFFFLVGTLFRGINQIKRGVQTLEYDLTYHLPPAIGELGEISEAVNHLANRLVTVQGYKELILANIEEAIVAVDLNGRLVTVNPAAARMFGLPPDSPGKPYSSVFPPGSALAGLLEGALRDREPVRDRELTWPENGQGGRLHLLASTGLLFNPRGELVGAVLSCRDITERKRMEDQMHRQERLAALGKLVAGVAHEIRNPLTAISGYIQFWQKHNSPSPESMDVIAREVARLNGLVEKLLFFSRPPEARFTCQDVNDLVERVLAFFRATQCDGLNVEARLAPGLPRVSVDPEQMEQALANVVYNACQAMPRGGALRVSTFLEPERRCVAVAVADEGPGIPPEHLPHLFDPFFTTKPKGAGLGLAIAYEIVRAHGGTIEVESRVGAGSVFRILIPVAEGREDFGPHTGG